jgi:hypothetical protein
MWIHVPATSLASAPVTVASSLDSTQPWMEELARSVTWKTNSVSPQSLRRVWKTVPSIRRLSGLTSTPSTQNRGVARWISSLEASHASPTASREASSEKMTQGNSQEKSLESPTGLDYQISFLKTSPESSDSTGTPSDPNYERWVTQLRKDSSQRQKQAHLTSENGSSSWPTVTQDSATPRKKKYAQGGNPLSLEATNWPTPNQRDWKGAPGAGLTERGGHQSSLPRTTTNWPTPLWMTPNTMDSLAPKGQEALDYEHETARPGRSNPNNLRDQAAVREGITNWPTPNAGPQNDSDTTWPQRREELKEKWGNNGFGLTLGMAATNWPTQDSRSTPQAPTTQGDGSGSSPDGPDSHQPTAKKATMCSPKCRRLNATFAEHLMGLCPGWTDDSEPLVMESFQRWQHSLSESLQNS